MWNQKAWGMLALVAAARGQLCPNDRLDDLTVADGYDVQLVASGLSEPRGIVFDSAGHLLVVESGSGITGLKLQETSNGCVTVFSKSTVVPNGELNHGIQLSGDGSSLYASTMETTYEYGYTPGSMSATYDGAPLISKMSNSDHTSRTLLLSKKDPGMLIVSRGSAANIDPLANQVTTGHAQIKAFNLNNRTGVYDFVNDGLLLAWGTRNEVGIAEHPVTGGIYGVENSVDEMSRLGEDIHEDNPAEEMNYFGTLKNNQSPNQGSNFGYPNCFSVWGLDDIPDNENLKVGMQFAIGSDDIQSRDRECQDDRTAPSLVFQAHMAPLDILFNTEGTEAWVSFHGSWDRSIPVGYKVSMVKFADGEPVEPPTSTTAAIDIVSNTNTDACAIKSCVRPVGLAWDSQGRLYFTSDETGEIYMISHRGSAAASPDEAAESTNRRIIFAWLAAIVVAFMLS